MRPSLPTKAPVRGWRVEETERGRESGETGGRGGSGIIGQRETQRGEWERGWLESEAEGKRERGRDYKGEKETAAESRRRMETEGERGIILIASPWLQTASTLC